MAQNERIVAARSRASIIQIIYVAADRQSFLARKRPITAMSNIIVFRPPRLEFRPNQAPAEARPRDFSAAENRAAELQSKARKAVQHAILLLDLAMEHAREIASYMPDQLSKERLEAQIAIIEGLLQIARDKTIRLEPFGMALAGQPARCAEPAQVPGGLDPVVGAQFPSRTFQSGDLP